MSSLHAASSEPGFALHQQGMNPTLPGEDAAPNYGAVLTEPLCSEGDASLPAPTTAMPNGVPTESVVERVSEDRSLEPAGPCSVVNDVMAFLVMAQCHRQIRLLCLH